MPSILAAAAMSSLQLANAGVPVTRDEAPSMPPPTKKKTKRKRAKSVPLPNYHSRSRYTPGGEHRNCGFNGISPKKVPLEKRV
jgi:hypothetical protein